MWRGGCSTPAPLILLALYPPISFPNYFESILSPVAFTQTEAVFFSTIFNWPIHILS